MMTLYLFKKMCNEAWTKNDGQLGKENEDSFQFIL